MQLRLDLIFFIVQMGATGPPRYTFLMQRYVFFEFFVQFSDLIIFAKKYYRNGKTD